MNRLSICVAVCAFFSLALSAHAQEDRVFPGERLKPSTDKESLINTDWAEVPDHLMWDAGLWFGYENDPLFTYPVTSLGNPLDRQFALVENRVTADVVFAIALFNWLQLGIDLPLVLHQSRDAGKAPPGDDAALGTFGFGDIRVDPKVRVLRQRDNEAFDLAVQMPVTLPTGQATDYFGERALTLTPTLLASRTLGPVRVAGNLGVRFRTENAAVYNNFVGTEVVYRVGVGYRFDVIKERPTEVALSLSGASQVAGFFEEIPARNPAEVLGEVQHDLWGPLNVFLGGGVGLIAGNGSPDFRIFGGVRLAERAPADPDGDGLVGDADQCPEQAEDKDGVDDQDGCPDGDNDADGIPDGADRCPDVKEDPDGFEDEDGCPDDDNDGDGVKDSADKCSNDKEDKDGFADEDGCPEDDNDGDGIVDAEDRCPIEQGVADNRGCPDTDRDGDTVVDRLDNCPDDKGVVENQGCAAKQLVVLTKEKLQILDKVFFDTDKDVIQAKSFGLLDNVAAVLQAHPEIQKVQIEGHTDNVGAPEYNRDLSARRAQSVVKYLVGKGVAEAGCRPRASARKSPWPTTPPTTARRKTGASSS